MLSNIVWSMELLSLETHNYPPGGMEREDPELCRAIPGDEGGLAILEILLQTGDRLHIKAYLPCMFGGRTLVA